MSLFVAVLCNCNSLLYGNRIITGIARYAVKKLIPLKCALDNLCCHIARPGLEELWKTENSSFQSLNSASFTGYPLKRKSIPFQ